MRVRRALAAACLLAVVACGGDDDAAPTTTTTAAAAPRPTTTTEPAPGALPAGLGDPFFPDLGAPGIDVVHYDVDLDVDAELVASGTVTLTLRATEPLARLAIDARSLTVSEVTVDGEPADFAMDDPELLVTPEAPLAAGDEVDVAVTYADDPAVPETEGKLGTGWIVEDGHSFTINEPEAARDWLPSLDHPSDKATWRFTITPPEGLVAVANGVGGEADGGDWVWEMDDPMATYLVQVLVGDFDIVEGVTTNGVPLSSAVLADDHAELQPFLDLLDDQVTYLESVFGPYPFATYGVAVVGVPLGLALEQQGRSIFGRDAADADVAAHELAHQWFGDAVTPSRWEDVWLNESFASYGQWLWTEHHGDRSVQVQAASSLRGRALGPGPATGTPTRDEMFGFNVYDGGAVVLHALRLEIGDEAFFALLRRWVADNAGTSRSTEDFTALAAEVAGRDLTAFFDAWLYADVPPDAYPGA